VISPQDWGLAAAPGLSQQTHPDLGAAPAELERRIRACTYEWAERQFDEALGAFYGFYAARERRFEPPQTVNLIAPWQLLATFDRYGDARLLARARRAAEWFYQHFVVTHPMSVVQGAAREGGRPGGGASPDAWTKFTAELVILNAGLYRRTREAVYLERARQSGMFLIQAARHGFAPRYNESEARWIDRGWQSFGRVVEACLELERAAGDPGSPWQDQALRWGELGLGLQAADGGYYLIDEDYFNSDLAADELRALIFLYERFDEALFLQAARRFGDWLLARQREDGAWPLTIDRDGNVVVSTAGPGDVPNIAISLIRLHQATREPAYLKAAYQALRYSLGRQAVPGSAHPYLDDENVRWGYWSWDPYYDFTLSADQSTHHVRGMMFALDTLAAAG
jgi:hypothetical protein